MFIKVKMLKTMKGSPHGWDVFEYFKDKTYDLPEGLAKVFIHEGWAVLIGEKTIETIEKKVVEVKEKQIIKSRKRK